MKVFLVLITAMILVFTGCNREDNNPEIGVWTPDVSGNPQFNTDTPVGEFALVGNIPENRFQLYKPVTKQGQKYPVLIHLHGSGGHTSVLDYPNTAIIGYNLIDDLMNKADNNPNKYSSYVVLPIAEERGPAPERIMEIITHLIIHESADPRRIYITGISMGGFATTDFILKYPDTAAAAVPICGAGNLDEESAASIIHLPIRLYHSDDDEIVQVSVSQRFYETITKAGGTKIEFFEISGYGHSAWEYAYASDMLEWIYSQSR